MNILYPNFYNKLKNFIDNEITKSENSGILEIDLITKQLESNTSGFKTLYFIKKISSKDWEFDGNCVLRRWI